MKHVVLVAGVDYEFKGRGVDFRKLCDNRKRILLRANKKRQEVTFTTLDFVKGHVVTDAVTYPKGKESHAQAIAVPRNPIVKANYTNVGTAANPGYRFKDNQANTMSIVDVYQEIQQIGTASPRSLVEVSVFSHGWMGGPILVNSFHDQQALMNMPPFVGLMRVSVPVTMRDPDDRDPRIASDFIPPTTSAADLKSMQDAFDPKGFVWLWGCAFPKVLNYVLSRVEHNKVYKSKGLTGSAKLVFTKFQAGHIKLVNDYIGGLTGPITNRFRIEMQFKHIKHMVCLMQLNSYAQALSTQLKTTVFAAPLGTYSTFDPNSRQLMHVAPNFKRHFEFYKNYMGATFDPEGRKYQQFNPGLTCPVP